MAKPTISPFPQPPLRNQAPDVFNQNATAFLGHFPGFETEVNAAIDWQNTTLTATQQAKDQAAASAQAASDSASAAAQSATQSSNSADASAQSATEAKSAVAALPEGTISDGLTAADKAWSSQKVSSELATKRDLTDTSFPRYDLASAATTDTLDLAQQQVFRVDASAPRTLSFTNAPGADRAMTVKISIEGNSVITWPTAIIWHGGSAPDLSSVWTNVRLEWNGIYWHGFIDASSQSSTPYVKFDVVDGDIIYGVSTDPATGIPYWLLAAPASNRVKIPWGLDSVDTSLPNGQNPDPNSGQYNTDILTTNYSGADAAQYCADNGYFLPNQQELNLIYMNAAGIDAADTSGGANTLSSMGDLFVWSSTEGTQRGAIGQRMSDGGAGARLKSDSLWVVPVRRIQL